MNPLGSYLRELRDIRSTRGGDPETSYYGALERLLNELGKTLKPKVRCVVSLSNRGAGKPDGGLFTRNQFQRASDPAPKQGQLPERGAVEVKAPAQDAADIAAGEQVARYVGEYGLVLVTNYRQFLLVGADGQGKPEEMEAYSLADDEQTFWDAVARPQRTADAHGERFCEYLKRVMLTNAPLSSPQDLAWFLASYARDARSRVERQKDLSALAAVREAMEQALGMKFAGDKGEHFFRSTLVQTIFYGVFSAWVLWHRERPDRGDAFDWRVAEWTLHVPFIRALYEEVATPSKLGPLGLVEVLDWTAAALNRVDRARFFEKFHDEHAVQYFYEPFLQSFDPQLRKQLGVWYTPPEIVQYQVARVDAALRDKDGLNIPDGLADPNVVVLDPCCGTGAYLVEVLKRIAETLKAKGGDALIASDLKKAAMERVFGFELLPAPFVVSHLQLGLMLRGLGAPLSASDDERVGVYLTNALTGWEPPKEPKKLLFPELEAERDAADAVKRNARILVILGNPPYNAFAGVSPKEEQGLVDPYKEGLNTPVSKGGWGIKKFNLDDLYVRFFRLAERRIAEMTGKGVVSFISNFSYLGDPSFVVMRQRFLGEFDKLWFDCMNGDSRETGKLTPEGKPDPSVFSTQYNREGIRVGTAICVVVRKDKRERRPTVRFRHLWGASKRQDLLASLPAKDASYTPAKPCRENRYSFRPENVSAEYNAWPTLPEICEAPPSNGLMEKRGGALIDIEKEPLEARMRDYFDPALAWDEYRERHTGLTQAQARFHPGKTRRKALASERFNDQRVLRYAVRPFEIRWCYYTGVRPVWNEPRPALWQQCFEGNAFLASRPAGVAHPEGVPVFFTSQLGDNDLQRGHAYYFPIRLGPTGSTGKQGVMFEAEPKANLSTPARAYLDSVGVKDPDSDVETGGLIWFHALGIGYSPAYLSENADGIRRDWPRVPLPDTRKALEASGALGRKVAALLDTEADVPGVTAGDICSALRTVGVLTKVGGGAADPAGRDLSVAAGWGHAGKGGATMPGKGRIVQRPFDKGELEGLSQAAKARGTSRKKLLALLGPDTRDVYLNDKAYWKNIPAAVWGYYIGGYQVIKKWLSYREERLLGRSIRPEEAREVMNMARRMAEIVLMHPALDANYAAVKKRTYPWKTQGGPA